MSLLFGILLIAAFPSLLLTKPVEGHGVPEQFQGQLVRISDEQFSDQTVSTGELVTVTGILQNQLDTTLNGLSLSIFIETAVQGKTWEIVSTKPSGEFFDIPEGAEVPYEMQLMVLKPGLYHIHTRLDIPDENMSLGRGQTVSVEGSPVDPKDIDSILREQNETAPVSEEEKIRRMLVDSLGQNVSKVDMKILNEEINCNDPHGMIQAVIFSSRTFDATKLQPDSIYMNNALEFHFGWGQHYVHEKDYNNDGIPDMIYHFNFNETELSCTDTMGYITAFFPDGPRIFGVAKLNMVSEDPPAMERFNSLTVERITSPARLEQASRFCPIEQTLKNTTDYSEMLEYAEKHGGRIDRPLCLHITSGDLEKFSKLRQAMQNGQELGLDKNQTEELIDRFNLKPYDLHNDVNRNLYRGFALIDNSSAGSGTDNATSATYHEFTLESSIDLPDRFWIIYLDVERDFLRSSVVVDRGSSITIPVAIEPLFSVDRPLHLNFTTVTYGSLDHPAVLPPGVSAKIEPNKLVFKSNNVNKMVVNLTISADAKAPDGTYGLRIGAMSNDQMFTLAHEILYYPYISLIVGNGSADLLDPSGKVCMGPVSNIANYQPYLDFQTYAAGYLEEHGEQFQPELKDETSSVGRHGGQRALPTIPNLENTTIPSYVYERAHEIAKSILLKNIDPFYNVTYTSVLYNVSLDGYHEGFFMNSYAYEPESLSVGIHARVLVADSSDGVSHNNTAGKYDTYVMGIRYMFDGNLYHTTSREHSGNDGMHNNERYIPQEIRNKVLDVIKKDPSVAALMQEDPVTSVSMTYADAFEDCPEGKYYVQVSLYSKDKWRANYTVDPVNYMIQQKSVTPIVKSDNRGIY